MDARVLSEQERGLSQWRGGGCPMSGKREAAKGKQRKDQEQMDGQSHRGENGYRRQAD